MADDEIFRILTISGISAVLPFALYFRIHSQASREAQDRAQEGVARFRG